MEPLDELDDTLPAIFDQIVHLAAGVLAILFIVWLIIYAITVIPRAKLFKLAGYPAWQAWVPFVNVFVQAKITGRSPWLFLGLYLGLPLLTYFPFIGGLFWLLPTLLTVWMCYDLAVVFGQSKRFALWFAIITASTVNYSLSGALWETVKSMMASVDYGITSPSTITSIITAGPGFLVQLLQLASLVLVYVLAFGSGTHYEGPYSHRNERMLMHAPWLFVPGPNQSIPVPPVPAARAYRPAQAAYGQPQGYQSAPPSYQPAAHPGPGMAGQPGAQGYRPSPLDGRGTPSGQWTPQPSAPVPGGAGQGGSSPSVYSQVEAGSGGAPQGAVSSPSTPPPSGDSGQADTGAASSLPDFPADPPTFAPGEPPTPPRASTGAGEEPTLIDGPATLAGTQDPGAGPDADATKTDADDANAS